MKLQDAQLIDDILKFGVIQFEKNESQGYYRNTLNNIILEMGNQSTYQKAKELILLLQEINPCPILITSGQILVLEFTPETRDFLNDGGYVAQFNQIERERVRERLHEDTAHIANENAIRNSRIAVIISIISLIWTIFESSIFQRLLVLVETTH